MSCIIDFHSHILPGIDDGSSCLEASIEMLRMEASQGIHRVVATPHFYAQHDDAAAFLRNRKAAEQRLREAMAKHADMPALSVGAEVYFFRGISQTDILRELAIDGGKYVLVEMPHCDWTDTMYRELEEIYNRQGLVPIMAHIDRYLGPIGKNSIMKRLEALPVLVQVNASFFRSGGSARKALKMLKKGQIHLIGSDCHNTRERSPKLGEAVQVIEKHLGQPALNWICEHQNMVLDL